jgi:L-threonylcarbamoyladenylate synthase
VTARLTPDEAGLDRAAALLRDGGLVAFPTETVYGLGADATNGEAVAGIYAAKERPRFNPLIAHVASLDAALDQGVFDRTARSLAEAFWPGPLTLVVPAASACTVSDLARAGLPTVALRVPAHPVAIALLARVGRPVAAPSANRSGRVSPTSTPCWTAARPRLASNRRWWPAWTARHACFGPEARRERRSRQGWAERSSARRRTEPGRSRPA